MLSSTLINTVSRLCSNVAAKSTIGVVRTKVSLPYLDWDFGALELPVSGQSEFHYSKHHQTYSNAYNFEIEQQIGTKSKGEVKRAIELQKNFKPIPEIAKKADSSKRIVIIGGSYAGINAAKSIFSRKDQSVNVTLISSSTNAYFNVSTPRLIVEPDKIDKTLFPVENTLKKYSNGVDYRFVLGKVVSTNFNSNSLVVEVDKNQKSIDYDYLIVASGSRTYNPAFKLDGNYQNTVASIKKLNRSTKGAKKIIILGGGATGVETAGELGFLYGKEKEIVLYTGLDGPLESFGDHKSKTATNKLAELGVQVVNNKRSSSLEESGSHSTVIFEDGSSEDADVVIPAYGLIPNSEFLDAKFLDSHGYLKTDEYLRVKGHNNVLGLGDILSISENSVADLNYSQMAAFESVVDREFFGNKNSKLKPYSPIKTTLAVPISRDGGVGLALGWSVPSFIIKFMKSKDFMISKASKMLA